MNKEGKCFKMIIPVVFTPDENYIVPTCVAILSMLRTKKENTEYVFYIVVSNQFDRKYFGYLDRIKEIEKEFEYKVKVLNAQIFENQKITTKHLSVSAYYRLALADILPDHDKCIYQDGDILVNSDLSEMYNTDLDDYYVAGVKAIVRHQDTEQNYQLMKKLSFPSFDNYIVSGNLVFNLSKIRNDKIVDRMLDEMERGFPSEDQDVINLCCYGKIAFLKLKFGMMNRWIYNNMLEGMQKQVYTAAEIEEAKKTPAIVHFAGANTKPWNNLRTAFGKMWWSYAKEVLEKDEYQKWYMRAEGTTLKRDWQYVKKQVPFSMSVIIFGFSKIGKNLFTVLKRWGCKIECFIDNDKEKQVEVWEGCKVLDTESGIKQYKGAMIVISSQRFAADIRDQLLDMGISSDRIIDYVAKNEIYYLSLSPEWREYELNDICIRDFGWYNL